MKSVDKMYNLVGDASNEELIQAIEERRSAIASNLISEKDDAESLAELKYLNELAKMDDVTKQVLSLAERKDMIEDKLI